MQPRSRVFFFQGGETAARSQYLRLQKIARTLENDAFFGGRRLEHQFPNEFASIQLRADFKATLHCHHADQSQEGKHERLRYGNKASGHNPVSSTVHILSLHKHDAAQLSVLSVRLNLDVGCASDAKRTNCAVESAVMKGSPPGVKRFALAAQVFPHGFGLERHLRRSIR